MQERLRRRLKRRRCSGNGTLPGASPTRDSTRLPISGSLPRYTCDVAQCWDRMDHSEIVSDGGFEEQAEDGGRVLIMGVIVVAAALPPSLPLSLSLSLSLCIPGRGPAVSNEPH